MKTRFDNTFPSANGDSVVAVIKIYLRLYYNNNVITVKTRNRVTETFPERIIIAYKMVRDTVRFRQHSLSVHTINDIIVRRTVVTVIIISRGFLQQTFNVLI